MIYGIYPTKDATIYKDILDLNSGIDEILELRAIPEVEMVQGYIEQDASTKSLSRILIQFDLSSISQSIVAGDIGASPEYYLKLKVASVREINPTYTIEAFPVSHSWEMGRGKTNDIPYQIGAVSWDYKSSGSFWIASGSENGGTWYTASTATQSFDYLNDSDLNMNVTSIVNNWLNGTYENYGFILKFSGSQETDTTSYGSINFFSIDTHTIYPPILEVRWDDSSFSTGSLTAINPDDYVLYFKNFRSEYSENSKAKIRLVGRDRYPAKTYTTQSRYAIVNYLPQSSSYSVRDAHTNEEIIGFDNSYTKISCDASGNYFNLWMDQFQLNRHYRILVKVIDDNGTKIFDNNYIFKVTK